MNTYYEILGLTPEASQSEIKKAYFKLIRKHSPESDPEQFQIIREAYEHLKNAANAPEGPSFAPFKEPLAEQMYQQIEAYRKSGNQNMFRKCSEEAWSRFPDDLIFLFLLIKAQRQCGNTGKAVKNAELLVSKEPDNKWFYKELAVSYMERGFTKKAYRACQKAYELGCRDLDFLMIYTQECDAYGASEKGVRMLFELIQQKEKWSKDEIPELAEIYTRLFIYNSYANEKYYPEIIRKFCKVLERYRIYMAEHAADLASILSEFCIYDTTETKESDEMTRHALAMLRSICRKEDMDQMEAAELEFEYNRIYDDPRICETLVWAFEAYSYLTSVDAHLLKFAVTDSCLCMIEERVEILKQAEIVRQDYPEFYAQMEEFFQKLQDEKNIERLKEQLQKTYHRFPSKLLDYGHYYKSYPEEKKRMQGTIINEGSDQPYVRQTKKIGRNEPCPCGSGKKYKQCCMKKQNK